MASDTKSKLESALLLASRGFKVFPLIVGGKTPMIDSFKERATTDHKKIKRWWIDPVLQIEQDFNIGISTEDLVVVDIDYKKGASSEGFEFAKTTLQHTPNGLHYVYSHPGGVKQGVDVLDKGFDIRSQGGYIVGAGSVVGDKSYVMSEATVVKAPLWIVDKCGPSKSQVERRVIYYLEQEAPYAVQGNGGDHATFAVAAKCKDYGVSLHKCHTLMGTHWNDKCSPPWPQDELYTKVENAYRYGSNVPGVLDPQSDFVPVAKALDPSIGLFNKDHAFVIAGNTHHIIWETKNPHGNFELKHLMEPTFHRKHASLIKYVDKKAIPLTKLWMNSEDRRSYDGFCFTPGIPTPKGLYNLWRGFSVKPSNNGTKQAADSIKAFFDHVRENICAGDDELANWLLGFFAHMIQKPNEKPSIAIVLRGGKGVGKNVFTDRIGYLLGSHYATVSDRRYLLGNFNSHLENKLMFVLDEAFWSGDKQANGILKALITSKEHIIERKGAEPYTIDNLLRVCILGNESWLVPASYDERRYAVFNVGEGKKQNTVFFRKMREGMEAGGYALLLRYLLDFDLSTMDIDVAPMTEGLLDQKVTSLSVLEEWWLECLSSGQIACCNLEESWPDTITNEMVREAYYTYHKRKSKSYIPSNVSFGKIFCILSSATSIAKRDGKNVVRAYKFPTLDKARTYWENRIGHKINWETI